MTRVMPRCASGWRPRQAAGLSALEQQVGAAERHQVFAGDFVPDRCLHDRPGMANLGQRKGVLVALGVSQVRMVVAACGPGMRNDRHVHGG